MLSLAGYGGHFKLENLQVSINPTAANCDIAAPVVFCDKFPNTDKWQFLPEAIDGGQASLACRQ